MHLKPEKNNSGINSDSAVDGAELEEDYFESDEPDDFYGRTREIISFAEKGPILNGQRLLEFSTTTDDRTASQELRVRVAALWLRVDSKPTSPTNAERRYHRFGANGSFERRNITLWIFRIVRPITELNNTSFLTDQDFDKFTELCAKLTVSLSKMGWQKFDLTHTIRKWYQEDSRTNLQLLIDCSGCGNRVEIKLFDPTLSAASTTKIREENLNTNVNDQSLNSNEKIHQKVLKHHILENGDSKTTVTQNEFTVTEQIHRPFLVVHTDPNIMKRVRRRALDCSGAARGQCCKQRFFVSFKALGWDDWIIAPHGYFANYCRGDCGGAHRTPDTYLNYHTHIMQEFRKNEDKMKDEQKLNGMQPCCAPLKFSSMSLIYFGPDSNIIKRDLPKMVVDECGCP